MKRISVKLALFLIALICLSSLLSFIISTIFNDSFKNEIKQNQAAIAEAIITLKNKTDLPLEDILEITSMALYEVRIIEDVFSLEIPENQIEQTQREKIIFISGTKLRLPTTLLMLDGVYIQIRFHPHNTMVNTVASRLWMNLFYYISIGTLLTILLVRKIVKPVTNLTKATQEVAKGNFDIQLDTKSLDEVGQLTINFNKMTRELKNIEYLRKDFISNVSHEFKTPIASIQGFAKLLQRGNLTDEERAEYTSIIVEETVRLSNLSTNLLRLSKLENQEIVEKKARFYLDEQIRKSILLLESKWSEKNIQLDIELDKVEYTGDEELLQQVWINLLSNAIKFSKHDGTIRICLRKTIYAANIEIGDDGIGMSSKTLARIFEKFYQGEEAHSSEGHGLGLSLVKRILDLYGGTITVESKLEEGSTFTIKLPLHP